MVGPSTGFLFVKDLEATLSLIESDSFDKSSTSKSIVPETFF